jgi:glutaredoxin
MVDEWELEDCKNGNGIILFTQPTCGKCFQIKKLMIEKKIPFVEIDVSIPSGLAEWAEWGRGIESTPLLVWEDGEVIEDIEEMLNKIKEWSK